MLTRWRQLVQVDSRWVVVTIDTRANQVEVPAYERGIRYFVQGTGRAAITNAARYTIAHTPRDAYRSRAKAEAALAADGRRVWEDSDGDLRVDYWADSDGEAAS